MRDQQPASTLADAGLEVIGIRQDGEDRKALGQQAFDDLKRLTVLVRQLLALPLQRSR